MKELLFENGKLLKKISCTKEREIKKFKILSIKGIYVDSFSLTMEVNRNALRKKAEDQKIKEANAFVMGNVELFYWRGFYRPYCGVLFLKIPR